MNFGDHCIITDTFHFLKELRISVIVPPVEEFVFLISFTTVVGVVLRPLQEIDGNLVPVAIFKNNPAFFHAFLIALNFAFTGAVTTMSLREKNPTMASYCRRLAVVSVVVAAGVFCCQFMFKSWFLFFLLGKILNSKKGIFIISKKKKKGIFIM